ncbi:type II CRISPR-associated endonuclease Cas1 [Kiritimatiellaeota bacterium B1221]|nr:type II CRISPR-associated endonuclease Cas1 [Kiritimatiellaeota bacterium B1221]
MIKRTLLFSTPCYLGVKNGQIRFKPRDADKGEQVIPLEDVGFVVLENPAITLSLQLIERLNANGTAMIFCDSNHMPASMLQSFSGNQTHAEVVRAQVEASLPLKKKIWKEIVQQKILNQAVLLRERNQQGYNSLIRLAGEVKSDDSDNREGVAARKYWQCLFQEPTFKRERDGNFPNPLLNYGYAILRAATARALVSSGLYCALGVHHRNRYNAFALADDVMEPYRPFVDRIVCEILDDDAQYDESLVPGTKQALLKVLTVDTRMNGTRSPLMVALSSTTASLTRCFGSKTEKILLPAMQ